MDEEQRRASGDRDETTFERADRNWDELMQELRVMQTGTQVLAGFLLTIAFTPRFTEMDRFQYGLYIVLVALAAVATILALAPVSLHRMLFGEHRKPDLVRFGSRIVGIALVVVGLLTVGVVMLIIDFTVNRELAYIVAALGAVIVIALWAVLPAFVRRQRRG